MKIVDDKPAGNKDRGSKLSGINHVTSVSDRRSFMGRGILLWLLGVPLPIIILLALFMR
jgi:bacteriorhodopsin